MARFCYTYFQMFDLETTISIKKISFVFFAVLGIAHFLAGAMAVQGLGLPASNIIMRVSYMPFAVASLVYAYSILKKYLLERGKIGKGLDYAFGSLIAVTFVLFFVLEFAFPDKNFIL